MWRAALALALWAAAAPACDYPGPPPGSGEARAARGDILWAAFSDATERYDHGVLGDRIEAGGLRAATATQGPCDLAVILPRASVFEDFAPRIADLDGDGRNEIVVVETDVRRGAALAIYGLRDGRLVKLTATPNIGATHRWLAPAGIDDLDGDGQLEIAYVDRPHLARVLRVWRYAGGRLTEVAQGDGVTNHRIGDDHISGGVRNCGGWPELVLADAGWRRLNAVRLKNSRLEGRDIGPLTGAGAFAAALDCR